MPNAWGYSEIDPSARKCTGRISQTTRIWNDRNLRNKRFPQANLIVGGSPCQDLSAVNTASRRTGTCREQIVLFFAFADIVRHNPHASFILENVASMPAVDRDTITRTLGVDPILVDSAASYPRSANVCTGPISRWIADGCRGSTNSRVPNCLRMCCCHRKKCCGKIC